MPRLSETMKDVVSCEKLREGANDRLIRRCPNGATQCREAALSARKVTRGTETSQYLEEKRTIVIPQVVASERGRAQTRWTRPSGVVGPT